MVDKAGTQTGSVLINVKRGRALCYNASFKLTLGSRLILHANSLKAQGFQTNNHRCPVVSEIRNYESASSFC